MSIASDSVIVYVSRELNIAYVIMLYIITKPMRALNQLWVIVPVNPRKNRASSELLYKSNRPQMQVSVGYRLFRGLQIQISYTTNFDFLIGCFVPRDTGL